MPAWPLTGIPGRLTPSLAKHYRTLTKYLQSLAPDECEKVLMAL
jgi:hypothetical protein